MDINKTGFIRSFMNEESEEQFTDCSGNIGRFVITADENSHDMSVIPMILAFWYSKYNRKYR